MSIWTPSGEHEITKEPLEEDGQATTEVEDLSPEEQAAQQKKMQKEFEQTKKQIAEAPVEQIISTHVIGLYELAVIHLQQEVPNLEAAKIAIDAMAGLLDGVEGQIGEPEEPMKKLLSDLQMAFVKLNQQEDEG